ncbi:MAG TPA: hypothetical protein VFM48_01580, partial [Aquabacterium sp.]|nr:hypothetical protein [Aquabacterium sp.]
TEADVRFDVDGELIEQAAPAVADNLSHAVPTRTEDTPAKKKPAAKKVAAKKVVAEKVAKKAAAKKASAKKATARPSKDEPFVPDADDPRFR